MAESVYLGGVADNRVVEVVKVESKWIDPTDKVCEVNGGEVKNGVCYAPWKEAKEICRVSEARLPNVEELKKVVSNCGGKIFKLSDNNWEEVGNKNQNNNNYQKCYNSKGFINHDYWSSSSDTNNINNACIVDLEHGCTDYHSKSYSKYVRCVRTVQ